MQLLRSRVESIFTVKTISFLQILEGLSSMDGEDQAALVGMFGILELDAQAPHNLRELLRR